MSYESIKQGLQNIIDYQNGDTTKCVVRNVKKREVKPVKKYTKDEIKAIRNENNLSQKLFAEIMGVTPQTVEGWEAGKSNPSGTASRLFQLIEKDKEIINKMCLAEQ